MRLLLPFILFSYCASALVEQSLVTSAPRIAIRDNAPNICGYYLLNGLSMLNNAISIKYLG